MQRKHYRKFKDNIVKQYTQSYGWFIWKGQEHTNLIQFQNRILYNLPISPISTKSLIPLLGENGPNYSFGIMLNGVELDPVAAEPFHTRT